MSVLLQLGIENRTSDIDTLYIRTLTNATPYIKAFKQTNFVRNRGYVEYYKQGFIMGNNANMSYDDKFMADEEEKVDDDKYVIDAEGNLVYLYSEDDGEEDEKKFAGAIVANPLLNMLMGVSVLGKRSNFIFNNVGDMDFAAMYPNITMALNIAPSTMYGKVIVNYIPTKYMDADRYDSGQDMMDNYLCRNYIGFGNKWLGLDAHEDLDARIKAKFNVA